MQIHTRVVHLEFDASGSAAGTIATAPCRYAGVFLKCDGSSITNFQITNMGRDLLASGTAANKFLQDLKLDNELLADGEIIVKGTGSAGEKADALLFFDR